MVKMESTADVPCRIHIRGGFRDGNSQNHMMVKNCLKISGLRIRGGAQLRCLNGHLLTSFLVVPGTLAPLACGVLTEAVLQPWTDTDDDRFQDGRWYRLLCKFNQVFEGRIVGEMEVKGRFLYYVNDNGSVAGRIDINMLPDARHGGEVVGFAMVLSRVFGLDGASEPVSAVLWHSTASWRADVRRRHGRLADENEEEGDATEAWRR